MGQRELPLETSDDGFKCPTCGYADDASCFDCLCADAGKVFCNHCNTQFSIADNHYEGPVPIYGSQR